VRRTGRCVIVHEAPRTGGFGAEIAARIAEEALEALVAPIRRVTAPDTIPPLPRLEAAYMPSAGMVVSAVREVMAWA
jgi:pyruvate dehydrogenase E1 component beta subunit